MVRKFHEPERIYKDKKIKEVQISQTNWKQNLKERLVKHISIIKNMSNVLINPLDTDSEKEILRTKVSFLMSFYDHCIHEIIKYKLIDIFNSEAPTTKKYFHFKVSMFNVKKAINNPQNPDWLKQEIEFQHGRLSFMNPDKTLEILELVTDTNLLNKYCTENNLIYDDFIKKLSEINFRRNKIVHEMDIFNKLTGERGNINSKEVEEWINLIEVLLIYLIDNI